MTKMIKKMKLLYSFCGVFILFFLAYVQIYKEEVMVEGWEFGVPRNTSLYISTNLLTTSILPQSFCDSNSLLIIMVCSAPDNFLARKAIRETWGEENNLGKDVSLYFLLGETVNFSLQYIVSMESEKYGDIVQENFLDSYNNLTLKSIVMMKLVSSYCTNTTKYLMKIDDDMFMNVRSIADMLMSRNDSTNLLVGKLICGAKPIKDTNSKWYSPYYMYSNNTYPNYLSGTGYLMSVDVAKKLYKTALNTPIFHLEDVFITGICATKAQIEAEDHPRFTYNLLNYEPCLIYNLFTAHHFSYNEMINMSRVVNSSNISIICPNRNRDIDDWIAENIRKTNKYFKHTDCQRFLLKRQRS